VCHLSLSYRLPPLVCKLQVLLLAALGLVFLAAQQPSQQHGGAAALAKESDAAAMAAKALQRVRAQTEDTSEYNNNSGQPCVAGALSLPSESDISCSAELNNIVGRSSAVTRAGMCSDYEPNILVWCFFRSKRKGKLKDFCYLEGHGHNCLCNIWFQDIQRST